jgi:hypothetical protein
MAQLYLYVVTNIFEECITPVMKLKFSVVHTKPKDWSKIV